MIVRTAVDPASGASEKGRSPNDTPSRPIESERSWPLLTDSRFDFEQRYVRRPVAPK